MKAFLLSVIILVSISAEARVTEHCIPEDPISAGFNYIELLIDDRGDYSLAIEWSRPVGREDVQEVAAEYYDDMTMHGFAADYINADLAFYDENDIGGERTVFEIDAREIAVDCKR